jgi:hypothetical protein
MTFLYVVHAYMFCNDVLYCIALPARVLFAIKDYYNNADHPIIYVTNRKLLHDHIISLSGYLSSIKLV